MERITVIAVDGESGAGKGTLSSYLAIAFGIRHWNSGLDYRAIGIAAECLRIPPEEVVSGYHNWEQFRSHEHVLTDRGGKAASAVAKLACVREAVNAAGRRFMTTAPGCVADGRSGAWEFPEIPIKLYLTCDLKERARRRCALIEKQTGIPAIYEEVLENLRQRDHADMTREVFPLLQHPDARVLDNTYWAPVHALAEAVRYCLEQMGR